jgi:hypothetical protein
VALVLPSTATQTTSAWNLPRKRVCRGRLASSLSHAGAALFQDGTIHLPRPPPPTFAPMTSANLPYLGPAARTCGAETPLGGALAVDATSGTTRYSPRRRLLASLPRVGAAGTLPAALRQDGGAFVLAAGGAASAVFRVAGGCWECPRAGCAGHDVASGVRVDAAAEGVCVVWVGCVNWSFTEEERTLTASSTDY